MVLRSQSELPPQAMQRAVRIRRRTQSRGRRLGRDIAIALGLHTSRHEWRIATYWTNHPLDTTDIPAQANFDRNMVSWCNADYVADPFLVEEVDAWYLFYEALNRRTAKGEIGVATSPDGRSWSDIGAALTSPYHLSYPLVLEDAGKKYLIPECHESGEVVLYGCDRFPDLWSPVATLLSGQFSDSTVFSYKDLWWMLTSEGVLTGDLRLFMAEHLQGPWQTHPADPIRTSVEGMNRSGGRVVSVDGRLVRFAQSHGEVYGEAVQALAIDDLTPTSYRESLLEAELLHPAKAPWAGRAMHHLDARHAKDGRWLVAVDGQVLGGRG